MLTAILDNLGWIIVALCVACMAAVGALYGQAAKKFLPCAKCGSEIKMWNDISAEEYLKKDGNAQYVLQCECGHYVQGRSPLQAFELWSERIAP